MKKKAAVLYNNWKQAFDAILFRTLFAKIRKTETNIKRLDRIKKTIFFLFLQILAISLFCSLGVAETKQLTYADTILIAGEIDDYRHIDFSGGRANIHYYNLWINEYKCRLLVNDTTCKEIQTFINSQNTIELRVHDRIFCNEVVEFYYNNTEFQSLDQYNRSRPLLRVMSIIIFSITEVFFNAMYILYIIFHRTSKDKRWI